VKVGDRQEGLRVRVTSLNHEGATTFVDPNYLHNRREGAIGKLIGPLKNDDDFWWVEHEDGTKAPYFYSEMELAPDSWSGFPLG
jgi:hypothetical protein